MLSLSNGTRIVQPGDDIPNLSYARRLYLDFETTSGDPKKKAVNPFRDCSTLGICITVDDLPEAYYIPVGHHYGDNIDKEFVGRWLKEIVDTCEVWENHNIKFDAHVANNDLGITPPKRLECTLTQAKIVDTDRMMKGGYGLDALAYHWLGEDIKHYEAALQPYLKNNKDYGAIPIDVMGEYGGQDVLTNRRLGKWLRAQMPEQCQRVWETEVKLTRLLFFMEQRGLLIDPQELMMDELAITLKLLQLDQELHDLVGTSFNATSNEDCFDVLCNRYGLPVLGWTDNGDPSFDKHVLAQYLSHPYAPVEVVNRILTYRTNNTLNNLFIKQFQEKHVNCVLHSAYNQLVRTGRMSCKDPNSQQFDKRAKKYVKPRPGRGFLSSDYSQIEFRTIVHYIDDYDAIAAYNADPDTDFHQWMADTAAIKRKPAKTLNFMMGFGGGKEKTVMTLSQNMDIVADVKARVDELMQAGTISPGQELTAFTMLCKERAVQVYNKYHETLPSLKTTSRRCARVCAERGYVFNLHGRRRHIPADKSHIAFNTINQSEAADILKERVVALSEALPDVPILALVHDEVLMEPELEQMADPRFHAQVAEVLETLDTPLKVPVRVQIGTSALNWADTDVNRKSVNYSRHL